MFSLDKKSYFVGPNDIFSKGRKKFREHFLSLSGYRTSPLQICAENFR